MTSYVVTLKTGKQFTVISEADKQGVIESVHARGMGEVLKVEVQDELRTDKTRKRNQSDKVD